MPNPALARAARQQQLRLRALTLRQLIDLWRIWKLDDPESFALFTAATLPLLRDAHSESSALAAAAYKALRLADGVPGRPAVVMAEWVPERAVTSLYVTGPVFTGKALLAGASVESAKQAALVRVTGAASRLVMEGGRETLRLTGRADPRQTGWRRITGAKPCNWCSGRSADAEAGDPTGAFGGHDHCACQPTPRFG